MKPKIAFFDFASCEGCQLQVANLEETLLDVLRLVDVVSFREVMKEHSDDYDIAVIEGSIARPMDEERVRGIRARAKVLIGLGACAQLGGVQRLGNRWTPEENKRAVYGGAVEDGLGDQNPFFEKPRHRALDEVVKVDLFVPGCPISRDELARVLVALLTGRRPPIPDYPLCVECKKRENVCLFTIGKACMGPVTRAGCGAVCPSHGNECQSCRGFISHPHTEAQIDVLRKHGLTSEDILSRRTLFTVRHLEPQGKTS